jgi:hypothetical protein
VQQLVTYRYTHHFRKPFTFYLGLGLFLFNEPKNNEDNMFNAPTLEQLQKVPELYSTENIQFVDKLVYLHFTVDRCHWWAMEFDGTDTFFGYVLLNGWLQDAEIGYFSLAELDAVKLGDKIQVQCDPNWIIQPAGNICLIREALTVKQYINKRAANF